MTIKQTHIIKGPTKESNFDIFIQGSGFKEINRMKLKGTVFTFKLEKDFSVKLKIYRMYKQDVEVNILA